MVDLKDDLMLGSKCKARLYLFFFTNSDKIGRMFTVYLEKTYIYT